MHLWLEIVAALLTLFYFIYKYVLGENKGKNKTDSSKRIIPGYEPSDPIDGNKKDIEAAGTLSDFVSNLHKKYGPIAKFYEGKGKTMSVSIAKPEMLKQIRHLFKVPTDLFEQFFLLTGKEVFAYSEIDEIKRRRKVYDHHFMMAACKSYSDNFVEISTTTVEKWMKTDGEQFSLSKAMTRYSLNALLRCCFGDAFKNEKTLSEYQDLVEYVFTHMDPAPKEGTEVYNTIVEKSEKIRSIVQTILDERRQLERGDDDPELFIDVLMNMDLSEDARKADMTGFISGGFFTVAMLLTWSLYEIARHPEVQDKIYEEILSQLGDEPVTVQSMPKLTYTRQVIDETLRIYLSPAFTARVAESDMEIGGYHIPGGTHIYAAFEPLFNDPQQWKNPEKFDPDRFSKENAKGRNPYSFKPFGFAGKRSCPGMSFALSEMTIFVVECVRHCRLHLVPGQDVKMTPGFIMAPNKEIMITIENRE